MTECDNRDRILIVDDEANMRSILMQNLSNERTDCIASRSPFDALNKIKREPFSLVISDIMMPGISGIELLKSIKKQNSETAVIMITGLMDLSTAIGSLRIGASDFITKPFDIPTMRRAVNRALERRRLIIENRRYREELECQARTRTIELNDALHNVEESYKITLEALVTALDAREHETKAHSQRVREYTLTLAQQVGLKQDEMVQIGRGALLHDVGKIGVPDSILLKPGKLSAIEWIEMKKHPRIGHDILQSIDFLSPAAEIVLTHQERWDGKGYPNGIAGSQIPLGSRIFAVVDTLDAMTSNRPYRKALSYDTAVEEIKRCSGTQFDPSIVAAFIDIPQDCWFNIHESVNRFHKIFSSTDLPCRK